MFLRHLYTSQLLLVSLGCLQFTQPTMADQTDVAVNIASCNKALAAGDLAKAHGFAMQALKLQPSSRNALLCDGRAQTNAGVFTEAINALQQAESMSQTPEEHVIALTLLGNAQRSAGQQDQALVSYRQSLAIAQSNKMTHFERINRNQIGDTLLDQNNWQAGLESYSSGSLLAANDNERADSYERMANAYLLLNQYDQAIEYQIKGTLMEESGGDLDHYANANLEMGRIYTAAKQYAKAEKSINRIIQLSKDQGGAYWEAKSYYYLGLLKQADAKPDEAKSLFTDAQRIASTIGASDLKAQVALALAKLG